jgi:hypothetical protein
MATYKVYKKGNYIIVEDSANKYWEEIAANTKISKEFVNSTDYTITFKDVNETWTMPFADIKKADGTAYADVITWENWYTANTGFNAATSESVAGILVSLSEKQDVLVSGETLKTINGASLLGSGNLVIAGGTGGAGDMTMAVYDPDGDGVVDFAETIPVTVRNNSSVDTLRKGTIVYLSGSTGYRPNAIKAQANTEITSSGTFGIVILDIAPNSDGNVAVMGTLHDLDTRDTAPYPFTADVLVDGDVLWLDPNNAGYVTKTKPQAPNHIVFIGIVARTSPTLGRIIVRISNGFELEELHNVKIDSGTLANNDIIQYNSVTSLWENKQPSSGGASEFIPSLRGNETYRGISINNNSTTVISDGGIVISSSASTLAQTVASTNFATKQIRLRYYASTVAGGRYTGTRATALLWYIHGGFKFVCDFNISDTSYSAGCQQFYGMAGQITDLNYGTATGILVSTLTNIVGVGSETGDANLQVFYNDAAGTATKIDLGVDFPANRTSGAISTTVYSIKLYNECASTDVKYEVINKETGAIAQGTLSTNLPLSSQGLTFFASRCMSASSVTNTGQFDLSKLGVYSII